MIRLVKACLGKTIHGALTKAFVEETTAPTIPQVTDSTHLEKCLTITSSTDIAYRQSWVFAMRHYPQMPRESRIKHSLAKPAKVIDQSVLTSFGAWSHRLGFNTPDVKRFKGDARWVSQEVASRSDVQRVVIVGEGVPRERICGLPTFQDHSADMHRLYILHLNCYRDD